MVILTVERRSSQGQSACSVLRGQELDAVDDGHVIETFAVNEELEATSHGNLLKGSRGGLVSMTHAIEFKLCPDTKTRY